MVWKDPESELELGKHEWLSGGIFPRRYLRIVNRNVEECLTTRLLAKKCHKHSAA